MLLKLEQTWPNFCGSAWVSLLHHCGMVVDSVWMEGSILLCDVVESTAPAHKMFLFWSLLDIIHRIFQLYVCEVFVLPQSVIGGRKLWVGHLLSKHYRGWRHPCTSRSLYESIIGKVHEMILVVGYLRGNESRLWAKSFRYDVVINVIAIPCSLSSIGRSTHMLGLHTTLQVGILWL